MNLMKEHIPVISTQILTISSHSTSGFKVNSSFSKGTTDTADSQENQLNQNV